MCFTHYIKNRDTWWGVRFSSCFFGPNGTTPIGAWFLSLVPLFPGAPTNRWSRNRRAVGSAARGRQVWGCSFFDFLDGYILENQRLEPKNWWLGSMLVFGVVAILRVWRAYEKSAFYLLYCWVTCQNIMEYRWYYIILYLGVDFLFRFPAISKTMFFIKLVNPCDEGETQTDQNSYHITRPLPCFASNSLNVSLEFVGSLGEGSKMLGIAIPGGWNCWGVEFSFIPKLKVWKIMHPLLGPCMAGSSRNGILICRKLQSFWLPFWKVRVEDWARILNNLSILILSAFVPCAVEGKKNTYAE